MNDLKNEGEKELLNILSTELQTQTELLQNALDLQLVSGAINGDEKAFEELYMFTYRFVYGVAKHYLNNDEDIYDAIQNTYIRVYKHIDKLNSSEKFMYWLRKIAENCAKTIKNNKNEDFQELEEFESEAVSGEKQRELAIDITEVLNELTPEQSEILVSVYYHGMSVAEIARNKGKPKSTIHSQLKAAEKKLKELLSVRGIETPIYGGGFVSMITTALRNAVGTSILSATVAQEILENVRKSDPKGSAVVTAIAKKERNKAVVKLASILVGVVAFFTVLFVVVILAMGGFSKNDSTSTTSNTTTSVENIIPPSSQSSEISSVISEAASKDSSTESTQGGGSSQSVSNISNSQLSSNSGNSSGNTQSKTDSSDTSSEDSSSKESTSSKNSSSSTYSVPTGPGITEDTTVLLVNENHIEYEIVNNTLKITEFHQDWQGTVAIPETIMGYTVTAIGEEAFAGYNMAENYTAVKIPKTVTSIGSGAFCYNMNLVRIEVDPENPVYYSENNCIVEKSTMTLVAGCKTSTIPSGIKKIGTDAFYLCGLSGTLAIPEGVEEIGVRGLAECYDLKILSLPSSLKKICGAAFWGCQFDDVFTIPKNVKEIGNEAFMEANVKTVMVPKETVLGKDLFLNCTTNPQIITY